MWLVLLIGVVLALAFLIQRQYTYWERLNFPYIKPHIPFGILNSVFQKKRSIGLIIHDIHLKSTEPFVGLYMIFRPQLLVRDAQLARKVLVSDFNSFHDRGLYSDPENDPFQSNLFTLPGQDWRTLRAKLTPALTSGKLKGMFGTVDDVGEKMVQYLNKQLEDSPSGKTLEFKEIMTTYAVDIIGSVILGLDIDSFSNPDNEMRKMHTAALNGTLFEQILNMSSFLLPPLAKLILRFGYVPPLLYRMRDIIQQTIEFREKHKVVRRDLLQLLIQLRNTGKISEDDDKVWDVETAAGNLKAMSLELLTSNAFLFYIAGTETTAATAAFTIYELSMYPEVLKRAQTEVEEVLAKHGIKPGDKFTYEALHDMHYIELCVMETTRKYPGLPFLNRECTADYQIPDTKLVVKKGTPVLISLFGMHRDPEYFPEPDKYIPERFLEESKNYDPAAYMPFGEGPRHCIAQRMGKINSALAIAKVLANFNIDVQEPKEPVFAFEYSPILTVKGGLNVRVSRKI